jgi:hypothetical protein
MFTTRLCRALRPRGLYATLLIVASLAAPLSATAAPPASGPAPLLAKSQDDGSFSIHKLLAGLNRRERIVQFCAGVMCLALFILCKKFNEDPE